ncbi:hypothetical protein LXL04_016008 [Taraxacum kok-saghyz]
MPSSLTHARSHRRLVTRLRTNLLLRPSATASASVRRLPPPTPAQASTSVDFALQLQNHSRFRAKVIIDDTGLMDGTSVEPLAQSVAGSTINQMEGIEGEEQSAPRNVDSTEQPTPPNQNPSEGATDKDQMEDDVVIKRKRKKTSKIWDHFTIDKKKLPTLIRPDKYDSNKMREAIATWVIGTEQPFSVVDDELYVNMMKIASPFLRKLQKRVLSFVHVPPPRTGIDISDAIYKCLKEWEIEDKIFTISVDNAAYNDKALKRQKEIFSRVRKLVCGGRLFHVRCCAHILNLLVRDGLGTVDSVIGEVREAIKYLNNPEERLQRFSDYAHQLQIKDRKFAESDPLFSHLPIDEEREHVESVCEILKVFKDCTTIISGSDYPTSNLYLIEVFRVKVTLDKGVQSENVFIRHMVTKMKEKFDKFLGGCHLVMAIASVLDPRFKMKLVEFSFPSIYNDAGKQIEEVKKALYMMYEEYLEIHDISVREATSPGSSCSGNTGLEKTPLGTGWEAFGEFIKNADLEEPEKSNWIHIWKKVFIESKDKKEWTHSRLWSGGVYIRKNIVFCQRWLWMFSRSRFLPSHLSQHLVPGISNVGVLKKINLA